MEMHVAPILDQVDIGFADKQIIGTFWDHTNSSWRKDPSVQMDRLWQSFATPMYIPIDSNTVRRLGKDPELVVAIPEEWNYGTDRHLAAPDVFHQLHCLDAIRRQAWAGYYDLTHVDPSKDGSSKHAQHLKHCVHMLVQHITCSASTDLLTYNWGESQQYPFPDFGVNRKCRDFEVIKKWTRHNMIHNRYQEIHDMKRPENAKFKPLSEL